MNKAWLLLVIGCLALTLPACQKTTNDATATSSDQSPSPEKPTSESPEPSITEPTVELASWDEVQKIASSTGKVTVLDVWSTVCIPCIKELPGLVDLQKEMGDQVQCLTLDIDFDGRKSKPPTTYEKDVATILESIGAIFPNYISTTPSDDIYAAADIDSIPAVLVFDAEGKLVKKFVDAGEGVGFGYHKNVIPFVKSLVEN